jgi:molybdate transport system regulatory protein
MNNASPGDSVASSSSIGSSDLRVAAQIRPAQRIWLQDLGTPVFGIGIRELLMRVETTGSLRQAAGEMGLAYSKAWRIVRRAEAHLGIPLLTRQAGGEGGGGSVLSDEARWLVRAFGALLDEARLLLDELYAKHFGPWPPESAAPAGNEPGVSRAAQPANDSARKPQGGSGT